MDKLHGGGCDGETEKSIADLRIAAGEQDADAAAADDRTLQRFLTASGMEVGRATAMFLEYLQWRRAAAPGGSVPETEVANELAKNKVYMMQGADRAGRPVAVVLAARHSGDKRDLDEFKRYLAYVFDKICSRIHGGGDEEQFSCIFDLKGWGFSNIDTEGYIAAHDILQKYYPERLAKVLVIHAPWLFLAVWKLVQPFIDPDIRKKIIFVEEKKIGATLREEIDADQLPEIYGGRLPLLPIDC